MKTLATANMVRLVRVATELAPVRAISLVRGAISAVLEIVNTARATGMELVTSITTTIWLPVIVSRISTGTRVSSLAPCVTHTAPAVSQERVIAFEVGLDQIAWRNIASKIVTIMESVVRIITASATSDLAVNSAKMRVSTEFHT